MQFSGFGFGVPLDGVPFGGPSGDCFSLLAVEIPLPDPDKLLDHAAGKSEVLFLVIVVLVLYAAASMVKFKFIDHPESKLRLERERHDIENSAMLTGAVQKMAQTTERQQGILETHSNDLGHIKAKVDKISQNCGRSNGGPS